MKNTVKILKKTFWVVMAIHFTVFLCIGLFTPLGWSMMYVFIAGLAAFLLVYMVIYHIGKRRKGKTGGASTGNDI